MNKEDLISVVQSKDPDTASVVSDIAIKYGCSVEKVYWTIRATFGDKLKNLKWSFREPSENDFLQHVLFAKNAQELRAQYNYISAEQWKGIYDRVLGVSTFSSAKEKALLKLMPTRYIPTSDNTKAMWAACRLGDGSYDRRRKSWKIEHCAAQLGWLERKVEMFHKAFPQASTNIRHNEKRNTYSWYSCKIGAGKFHEYGCAEKHTLVELLNDYGLWFLFLDDGCYSHTSQQVINYAVENMEIATRLCELLVKKGHPFRVANKNTVVLTGIENILKFFKDQLEPFNNLVPECMKYKTTYVKI